MSLDKDKVYDEIIETLQLPTRPIPDDAFTVYEFIDAYEKKSGRKIGHSWAARQLREAFREGKFDRERYKGVYYYWHKDVPSQEAGD